MISKAMETELQGAIIFSLLKSVRVLSNSIRKKTLRISLSVDKVFLLNHFHLDRIEKILLITSVLTDQVQMIMMMITTTIIITYIDLIFLDSGISCIAF